MLKSTLARPHLALVLGWALVIAVSCTKKAPLGSEQNENLSGTLQAPPKDPESIDGQLARFHNQTKFLSLVQKRNMARNLNESMPMAAAMRADGGGTDKREIEEADIFKIDGDLIYLLNNYRGIQVIRAPKPANPAELKEEERPVLLARVAPTGNMSQNMFDPKDIFFDEKTRRLYIIESYYYDPDDYYYSSHYSRIVSYEFDKGHPEVPGKKLEPLQIDGEAQVWQRVGQVLYVGAIQFEGAYPSNGNTTGKFYSYNLKGKEGKIEQVGNLELAYPFGWSGSNESMTIIETAAGKKGKYRYYAVVRLSKSLWSWGESNNFLEVIDITDPKGTFNPLMVVAAKGRLEEKSQVFLRGNNLVVVSNYRTEYTDNRWNIAVESFELPSAKSTVITQKAGAARRAAIEESLESIADLRARYKKEQELVNDPARGLKGVFINTEVGDPDNFWRRDRAKIYFKVAPDQLLTLRPDEKKDDNMQIQDVRLAANNQVFIFWVKAPLGDPLDIVDISNPAKGFRWLGRTHFSGDVQKAFPVVYQNKQYIIALGRVVPPANNETGVVVPQVRIWQVPEDLEELKEGDLPDDQPAVNVASYMVESLKDTWISFQGPDKEIPLVPAGKPGQYVVMFPFSSWNEGNRGSGAMVIGIDLNKKRKEIISETTLYARNMDWLRRVFKNENTQLTHTFSDKQLGTFSPAEAGGRFLSLLELARDVRGYASLKGGGVQIIEEYTYDDDGQAQGGGRGRPAGLPGGEAKSSAPKAALTLRLVDPTKADSELPAVKDQAKVAMPYRQQLLGKDGDLYLIGTESRYLPGKWSEKGEEIEAPKAFLDVSVARVVVADGKIKASAPVKVTLPAQPYRFWGWGWRGGFALESFRMIPWFLPRYQDLSVAQLPTGEIALSSEGEVRLVRLAGEALREEKLATKGCVEKADDLKIDVLNGQMAVSYSVVEGPAADSEWQELRRNFLAKGSLKDGALNCEAAVNIPGEAKFFLGDKFVVAEESYPAQVDRVKVKVPAKEEGQPDVEEEQLMATQLQTLLLYLELKDGKAFLRSSFDASGVAAESMHQVGNKLVFLEAADTRYNARNYGSNTLTLLEWNEGNFPVTQPLDLNVGFNPHSLVSVVEDPAAEGKKLVLVTSYRRGAVLSLDLEKRRLNKLKSAKLDTRLNPEEAAESFELLGGNYLPYGRIKSVNFTPANRSFEFAEGLFGVEQVVVEK